MPEELECKHVYKFLEIMPGGDRLFFCEHCLEFVRARINFSKLSVKEV